VTWFCEQPTAIGYTVAGRHRPYHPDLLAAKDFLCPPMAGGSWSQTFAGLNDLLAMLVPAEASRHFADALRDTGTMTWQDIEAHRVRRGLTPVQAAALAGQRGWYISLSPYRMTERPPPPEPRQDRYSRRRGNQMPRHAGLPTIRAWICAVRPSPNGPP
jgi:hypothetical protein